MLLATIATNQERRALHVGQATAVPLGPLNRFHVALETTPWLESQSAHPANPGEHQQRSSDDDVAYSDTIAGAT